MGLRPNGGLISSELLIECIPDMGAEEEICVHSAKKEQLKPYNVNVQHRMTTLLVVCLTN